MCIAALVRRFVLGGVLLALFAMAGGASAGPGRVAAAVKGEVAYVRVREVAHSDTRAWIAVADLAGAGRHEITKEPGKTELWEDAMPLWSPDGSQLAFLRLSQTTDSTGYRYDKGSGSLFVANRDGSGLHRVLRFRDAGASSGWSDGRPAAYTWSPDGRRLAFASGSLFVVNRDGTNLRTLVAGSACIPFWSPDGDRLLYMFDATCQPGGQGMVAKPGFRALYRINADGTDRRLLARGSFGSAAWSPNGRQIAVTDNCDVAHGQDWFCSVSLMSSDGTGKRQVVQHGAAAWVHWVAGGTGILWSFPPQVTTVANGHTHKALSTGWTIVGLSKNGATVAVYVPKPTAGWVPAYGQGAFRVTTVSGRLLQRVAVPSGWKYGEVSFHLP